MDTDNLSISVVLPAYNEEANIASTIQNCENYLDKKGFDYEIIAVNDGSCDNTEDVIKTKANQNKRIKLVSHSVNKGYGAALRSGFDNASKEFFFLMDSDGQFKIDDLDVLLPKLDKSTAVIGYRKHRADPFIRSLNAYLFHIYVRLFFGLSMRDLDCAFKIFSTEAYRSVEPIISSGALFSTELLLKLQDHGLLIVQTPVNHYPRIAGEQSGANLKVIARMFVESWNLRKSIRNNA